MADASPQRLVRCAPVEKGVLRSFAPVFRFTAAAAASLIIAFGAPFFVRAQTSGAPPAPLTPITLPGDAERGAVIAQTCTGCHGIPGYFNAQPAYHVPKLGGQNADYIEVALLGYRRGTRSHDTMQAQASSLSDQDIADVAAYFESFKGEAETGRSRASAATVEAGRAKAATCVACHGPEGVAAAPQWPNLAGQQETYLRAALEQYKNGGRVDMVMNPLIQPLDDAALEELAAFFAAQPHLYYTEP
jgi:cytochrome c553